MRIGFVGLGAMGEPIARRLAQAGHVVLINDLSIDSVEPLLALGMTYCDTPAATVGDVELVFTCLPGPAVVEEVALGRGGLAEGMRAGSAWFDLTTNSPETVCMLHERFAELGVDVLDCPVSGGPGGAASGDLALWVGGSESVFSRYLPVLSLIGDRPLYLGPIGAGCITKLVHNSANLMVQSVLAEAFALGVKAGMEPGRLFKAIRSGSTGRQRTFDRLAEQFLSNTYDPPRFALKLAQKDMRLALDLAESVGFPMRFAEVVADDMKEAMDRDWGGRDARIILHLQEEKNDVSVTVPAEVLAEIMRL